MNRSLKASNEPDAIAIEWLTLLRSGSITSEQEQMFFEWLEADIKHQRAFIRVDELWQRGGALAKAAQNQAAPRQWAWPSTGLWLGTGLTAVCVLFSMLLLFGISSGTHDSRLYQTSAGVRETIVLEDGSRITLNANSKVRVNLEEAAFRKVELLRGEVFFDVAHNKNRPFSVHTTEGEVTVLGTRFSVNKSTVETQVTVLDGQVRVVPVASEAAVAQQAVSLVANQQSRVRSGSADIRAVDARRELAWRDGVLRFEGAPLSEVVSELSRYYSVRITLAGDAMASLRVVAVLPLDDDVTSSLEHLERSLGLLVKRDPVSAHIQLVPAPE